MTIMRQDAWTQDEDLLLAEVTLRHIRESSTQLSAFEEVGEKLTRTPAACGFRWNSLIRKQHESAILLAKQQRKERNRGKAARKEKWQVLDRDVQHGGGEDVYEENDSAFIDKVILFLRDLKEKNKSGEPLEEENRSLRKQLLELESRHVELKESLERLNKEYTIVCEDYKALIGIMDRARQRARPQELEASQPK
ncbi:RsfA family transcriptional regulator [Fictibacillus iocasae]|uniref:RsfA family transcriptional regulator n=1 Tax=Fictibacillus iocasae TaxID=2715437 RepID=A0ABW2NN64_9BACL